MLRCVQTRVRWVPVLCAVVMAWLAVPTPGEASAQAPGTISAEEQQRRLVESRNEFLRSVDRIPRGGGETRRREDFRDDLRTFREELVGLWALRFAPMDQEWARDEMEERTDDIGDTLRSLRSFVDRESDPPDFEPASLEGDTLAERLDLLVAAGLRLRTSAIQVTEGAVLDIELLNSVRRDFATLESWAEEFHELAKQ